MERRWRDCMKAFLEPFLYCCPETWVTTYRVFEAMGGDNPCINVRFEVFFTLRRHYYYFGLYGTTFHLVRQDLFVLLSDGSVVEIVQRK